MSTTVTNRISPLDALGQRAERNDDALQALRRARLDFDVDLVPVRNPATNEIIWGPEDEEGNPQPKFLATVRKDTKDVLGIVEGRYRIFQNSDVFSIADTMAQEDGAIITRASAIDNGARCFMTLEWPRDKSVSVLGDIVSRRAILQNSHDGKFAAIARLMPMRLACMNGMVVPVPAFTFEFRIKHTESGDERLNQARGIMAGASQYFETFGKIANRMAELKVTETHAKKLLESLPAFKKDTTASGKKLDEIMDLFNGAQAGGNHEAVRNTAWGWFNAVAEFADHSGRIRKTRGNDELTQRFKNVIEGAGARLKVDAYESLLKDDSLGLGDFYKSLTTEIKQRKRQPSLN